MTLPPIITKQGNIKPKISKKRKNTTPKAIQRDGLANESSAISAATAVVNAGAAVLAGGKVIKPKSLDMAMEATIQLLKVLVKNSNLRTNWA